MRRTRLSLLAKGENEMILNQCLRVALVAALSLILSACYFIPGKYDATLDIRRDGTFTFRYVGELVFALPKNKTMEIWDENELRCFDEKAKEGRICNAAEVKAKKQDFDARQKQQKEETDKLATIFGYNVSDEAANAKLADRMMQSRGWKSAVYKGSGIYEIDYQISGNLDRDMVFPVLPDTQASFPFIVIRPSSDGAVEVSAKGLSSGLFHELLIGQNPKAADLELLRRTNGTFTITTDAEILSSNGGTANDEKSTIRWVVVGGELVGRPKESPRALLRVSQPNCGMGRC